MKTKPNLPTLVPGQYCYYVPDPQDTDEHGGFVPSLVIEHHSGHYPMTGDDDQRPWVWGDTIEKAKRICKDVNRDTLGLSDRRVAEIVASTMR